MYEEQPQYRVRVAISQAVFVCLHFDFPGRFVLRRRAPRLRSLSAASGPAVQCSSWVAVWAPAGPTQPHHFAAWRLGFWREKKMAQLICYALKNVNIQTFDFKKEEKTRQNVER